MARRLTTNQEIAGSIPASINKNMFLIMETFIFAFCLDSTQAIASSVSYLLP
jgi:hypothetical protein